MINFINIGFAHFETDIAIYQLRLNKVVGIDDILNGFRVHAKDKIISGLLTKLFNANLLSFIIWLCSWGMYDYDNVPKF